MRGWKLAGVGLAVGTLVLTGCGGGGTDSPKSSTATSPQAAATPSTFPMKSYSSSKELLAAIKASGSTCEVGATATEDASLTLKTADALECKLSDGSSIPILVEVLIFASESERVQYVTNSLSIVKYLPGDAMYFVPGQNWGVRCFGAPSSTSEACSKIARGLGGQSNRLGT